MFITDHDERDAMWVLVFHYNKKESDETYLRELDGGRSSDEAVPDELRQQRQDAVVPVRGSAVAQGFEGAGEVDPEQRHPLRAWTRMDFGSN